MGNYKPHIGKNVIETLTLGMYENSLFIYREYVQNAADQIDVAVEEGILDRKSDGEINIIIDDIQKSISIEDNATGIKSSEVLQFLGDVANSQKDRTKRKGFRGIGRLGGLGYCEKLIFETTYKGEATKSIITLDAKDLKRIVEDRAITMDAATVISVITARDKDEVGIDEHYFKVKLNNVTNDVLLDEIGVKNYLSMVAPVPFSKNFPFYKKIHTHFNKSNIKIEEYDIHISLNSEKLYKAYKKDVQSKTGSKPVKVIDVGFLEIRDEEQELIALGWYGITDLLNNIIHQDDIERGFRIRKDNIQIGSEDTLNRFFKEDRFNHHFIGEVHVLGNSFIPNARRDYFNDNKTIQTFEINLEAQFDNLYKIAHTSSDIHSSVKKIIAFKIAEENFCNQEFRSEHEETKKKKELNKLKVIARTAAVTLNKVAVKAESNDTIRIIYNHKISDLDLSVDNSSETNIRTYIKPTLSKLNASEKELVFDIFKIIEENIKTDDAENLKQKIAEYYN